MSGDVDCINRRTTYEELTEVSAFGEGVELPECLTKPSQYPLRSRPWPILLEPSHDPSSRTVREDERA